MTTEITNEELETIEAMGDGVYLQKSVARGLIARLRRVEREATEHWNAFVSSEAGRVSAERERDDWNARVRHMGATCLDLALKIDRLHDLSVAAWGVIANVSGGAAAQWRGSYHEWLEVRRAELAKTGGEK